MTNITLKRDAPKRGGFEALLFLLLRASLIFRNSHALSSTL